MEWIQDDLLVSTDKSLLSIEMIHQFLSCSAYWAIGRTPEQVKKSIDNSLCYGVYLDGIQAGFCRVITDYATFYWLADVFVLSEYRGRGLGKFLVGCVVDTPQLKGLRGLLATRDAHSLYSQFGFKIPDDPRRYMARVDQTA